MGMTEFTLEGPQRTRMGDHDPNGGTWEMLTRQGSLGKHRGHWTEDASNGLQTKRHTGRCSASTRWDYLPLSQALSVWVWVNEDQWFLWAAQSGLVDGLIHIRALSVASVGPGILCCWKSALGLVWFPLLNLFKSHEITSHLCDTRTSLTEVGKN